MKAGSSHVLYTAYELEGKIDVKLDKHVTEKKVQERTSKLPRKK